MRKVETIIVTETWDVECRLAEMKLNRETLISVINVSRAASADTTPFHCANAAGTLAYQHGTFALRNEFIGNDGWEIDRSNAVEAIINLESRTRIVFANVDHACDENHPPKPRSRKGAGSERVCSGNLFDYLPRFAPQPEEEWATYYLMVDTKGAAELSRPVISNGTFSAYIERIYVSSGENPDEVLLPLDHSDIADDFDPQVARK